MIIREVPFAWLAATSLWSDCGTLEDIQMEQRLHCGEPMSVRTFLRTLLSAKSKRIIWLSHSGDWPWPSSHTGPSLFQSIENEVGFT